MGSLLILSICTLDRCLDDIMPTSVSQAQRTFRLHRKINLSGTCAVSHLFKRQLTKLVHKLFPSVELKFVYLPGFRIANMFNYNLGKFSLSCKSMVVYYTQCKQCVAYIGSLYWQNCQYCIRTIFGIRDWSSCT